ncbi:Spore wall protein 12 [Nosema granulosis]|uniref:Spore wall protein 12 n=1 Tax=Nosema granulosis TaxID=83296 RepID=A0A9P6GY84_9MICR|nr:Spore wall protein 12 [Nosema granulosis]
MKDLKKKILMKISRIEYKHTNFSAEYKDVEKVYKKLRDNLDKVATGINSLMTYEHGGSAMKKLYHGLSVVSNASKTNYFSNSDIFEAFAHVNKDLTDSDLDEGVREVGRKTAEAYGNISKAKFSFNEKCEREMEVLRSMRKRAENIDKERENTKIYRYDLEKHRQNDSGENQEDIDRYSELFENAQTRSIEMMKDFIGADGLQGVLGRIRDYNIEFYNESLKALERSK